MPAMEDLPPHLILDILNRLSTITDLSNCRCTCKTLYSISYDVTTVTFTYYFNQYINSRSSSSSSSSFKDMVKKTVAKLDHLDTIRIGVDDRLQGLSYDDVEEDDGDDLYLSDVGFVNDWLLIVCDRLKFVCLVDFWVQSCWRKSRLLSLFSKHCNRLSGVQIKNAWLSLDEVSPMPALTSLTLEYVRVDNENLSNLNDSFPCLETLNLIGVGGLIDPKINLRHLKNCRWSVTNIPHSVTISSPKLVELKLKCVRPNTLVLETPLLSDFNLTIEKASRFDMGELLHLKKLHLESRYIRDLISAFPCSISVKELSLNLLNKTETIKTENTSLDLVFDIFPNMRSLNLGSRAYAEMEASFGAKDLEGKIGMMGLRNFTAHLVVKDIDSTVSFISFILNKCKNLATVALLIHHELNSLIRNNLISRCVVLCPRVKWKWGIWKQDYEEVSVSGGV